MSQDYIPKSFSNLKAWLTSLRAGVNTDGPTLGQTPAQIADDDALIDSLLTPVTDAEAKETAALEASGTARAALQSNLGSLRNMINRYKAAPGWNTGIAAGWSVVTHETSYDMNTHKPTITARSTPGAVVISGKKPGFTSVTILMRLDGTAEWTSIGIKINHFPFYDTTAPGTPGKPEKREYRALGMVGDAQAGLPSDIVTAIYG